MKIEHSLAAFALLSAGIVTPSLAASPDWNTLSASYVSIDIDDEDDISPSGIGFAGSRLLGENIFVLASYSTVTDEYQGVDIDFNQGSAGLGYRYATSSTTDVYVAVSFEYVEVEASYGANNESIDDNGYGITTGFRSRLTDVFEVDANISNIHIDGESETGFGIGANYYFAPKWSAGIAYSTANDVDALRISARYSF